MSFNWIEKTRLQTPLRGTFLSLGSPLLARMAAQLGFDWVLIDLEHGACSEAGLQSMLLAVEGTPCVPIVRVVSNDQDCIKRALDLGAAGVMVLVGWAPPNARKAPCIARRGCTSATPIWHTPHMRTQSSNLAPD